MTYPDLADKVVLVTGGPNGIGAAMVRVSTKRRRSADTELVIVLSRAFEREPWRGA